MCLYPVRFRHALGAEHPKALPVMEGLWKCVLISTR